MGYTHYWYRKPNLTRGWNPFLEDCRKALVNLPKDIIIRDEWGKGIPKMNKDIVAFNGDDETGASYETFYFPKVMDTSNKMPPENGLYFQFTKTARKPYDLLVTSCLLIAKKHFKSRIKVSSDGDKSDWKEAYKYCNSIGIDVSKVKINRD